MKIRLNIGTKLPVHFTTVGYWKFDGLCNTGTLQIYCVPLAQKRWVAAVVGHELIESLYCWWFKITTEQCDRWDSEFEKRYRGGTSPVEMEPGDDPQCPYHWGHLLGCVWERLCIALTFAGWKDYTAACDLIYHEMESNPTMSQKTLP